MKRNFYTKHLLLASSVFVLGSVTAKISEAAFEWTPPAVVEPVAEVEADEVDVLAPAPIDGVEVEGELPVIPSDNNVAEEDKAPVEYLQGDNSKEMTMTIPADSEVAEDLVEIIEEAEENNVITPIAAIPEEEKIDTLPEDAAKPVIIKVEDTPVMEDEAVTASEQMPMEENNPDIVKGFGNDLPLVSAVRQIVPTNMPFSFGENIEMGTPVSWEGGQTWQKTLEGIASQNNMRVEYSDNLVRIVDANSVTAIAEPAIETVRIESVQETVEMVEPAPQENIVIVEETEMTVPDQDDLLSLEEVVKVADAEIKASTNIAQDTEMTVVEISEEEMEEQVSEEELQIIEEAKEVILVEDNMAAENEVLEATISDAIIISPIENMDGNPQDSQMESKGQDVLSTISEGTVIGRVDEPQSLQEDVNVAINEEATIIIEEEEILVDEELDTEPVMAIKSDITVIEVPEPVETLEMTETQTPQLPPEEELASVQEMVAEPMPVDVTEPVVIIEEPAMVEPAAAMTQSVAMMKPESFNAIKIWKVKKNSDLKSTLEKWTQDMGVNLQWNMQQDYEIDYMVWVEGNFEEALDVLMQGYENEKGLIPSATMSQDAATGQPVLIIEPAA